MATNAEEFLLKLKSNLQPVASRDEAALRALDAQVRAAQRALQGLDAKAAAAAAAAVAQEGKVAAAAREAQRLSAGYQGSADVGRVRAAQAKLAAEQRALDAANANAAATRRAAEAGRAELAVLQQARPALAAQADAAREAARAKAAASASEKEQIRVAKEAAKVQREAKAASAQAKREAKEKEREQAKAAREAAKAQKEAAGAARDLGSSASALGGPLGNIAGKLSALGPVAELSASAIVALGATALAVVLVAGAVAATAALVKFALSAAAARRDAVLLGDALAGVSRRPGQEFTAVVDQLARRVPLARSQLQEMAKEMALLKLGGRDLQAGLTATAMVTSALGDAAGRNVRAIVEQSQAIRRFTLGARDIRGEFTALAGTGLTKADVIGALARQLGKSMPEVERMLLLGQVKLKDGLRALEQASKDRFGKTVAAQMMSVDDQLTKAKESFASLFDGINLTPALEALQSFFKVFDEGTVGGKNLRFLVNTGVQDLVKIIAAGLPIASRFFDGMVDAALELYIALAPPLYRAGKFISQLMGAQKAFTAVDAGKVAFYALAAAAVVVGASILLAMSPIIVIGGIIAGGIWLAIAAWDFLKAKVDGAIAFMAGAYKAFSSINWSDAGSAIIDALVNSIKDGAARFVGAVKDLARSGLDAFRNINLIRSPAGAYKRLAVHIPPGAAAGVEQEAPQLGRAVADMSTGAQSEFAAGAPSISVTAPGGNGSGSVTNHFYISGDARKARDIAEEVIALMTGSRMGSAVEVGT